MNDHVNQYLTIERISGSRQIKIPLNFIRTTINKYM